MSTFIDTILYSYAQIFFSNRRWVGASVLASSFFSPVIGCFALLGAVISTLVAYGMNYNRERIHTGFYGFNGILFGAAAAYYCELTPLYVAIVCVFIVVTFFASTVLEHYLASSFNLPGLSLPFIIALDIFLTVIGSFDWIQYNTNGAEAGLLWAVPEYIRLYFHSFGYVLFQSDAAAGAIIASAVLFFSRVLFVNSIIAYALNYFLVTALFADPTPAFIIQTSFNAILVSFALGGSLIIVSRKTIVLIAFATVASLIFNVFFTRVFGVHGLPIFVLPFNVVVLATIYSLKFRQEQSDLVLLYFSPGSPEENYYYHQNRKARFDKFRFVFPELPFFGEWRVSQGINGAITHQGDWRHAWDFVIADESGKEYKGNGLAPEDYYCYNTPVVAPLEGDVVRIVDTVPDNAINDPNLKNNWGNTIIINHGQGLYSSLSHLRPESFDVRRGDHVHKGQTLARCGNSGRSPVPHLHFQFQLTDRLGEKTYLFPLSQYFQRKTDKTALCTFDYPDEGALVRNIETHSVIRRAFDFRLGQEYDLTWTLNGEHFTEQWEVKVDTLNAVYIESSRGTVAYIHPKEKVFFMAYVLGDQKSALFYFYLLSISVPLGYGERLRWTDVFPVSLTIGKAVRFLSEFLLVFTNQLSSSAEMRFEKKDDPQAPFIVASSHVRSGRGLFAWFREEGKGSLTIDADAKISELHFKTKKITFHAAIKEKEIPV
jgi:murein DD-endopeptidase MepM/ murein hydrolase activator NlpD/urea transporter